MVTRYLLIAALIVLTGCAPRTLVRTETVTVEIPVLERRVVPEFLLAPVVSDLPLFVPPGDPQATSALTPEGEKALKRLLLRLKERDLQWRAWATAE